MVGKGSYEASTTIRAARIAIGIAADESDLPIADGDEVIDQSDYPEGSARRFFHPDDAHVVLPPEFIGHVMVFRTFQRVSYGLVMDAVKPTHIGDFLWDPDHTP